VLEERDQVLGRHFAGPGGARHVVVEELLLALDFLVDGADGDGARHLPGCVPAHSVRDDEERELLVDEEIVLVVIAHPADVGRRVEADRVAQSHA